ncbi:MAG: nitrite/sulfite reductase [Myxococcales bacterium]|nr:nitrite/sulfite reductase [Myxococcales bacterium]
MTAPSTWKEKLDPTIREDWRKELEVFETQIQLKKQGRLEDKIFAETRLRRGTYGQRYDNGQRHDGVETRKLQFPSDLTKGPDTLWDAPGMQRIKIPFGKLTAQQLEVLCDLAEEYSDQILHVTTRQDIQLHFVHIEDTPDLMRRLAAVGITTREACGNSVRNITACPYAGVCRGETFDVTPYANAIMFFLLGHDDTQDFGRKFKIAFSGCKESACGLTNFHDVGCIARVKDGRRGFQYYVGGGLGAVPQAAFLLEEFVPEEELFPLTQAVCRVFGKLGEKQNRSRARLKFLVKKLGIEEFRRLVLEERENLRPDPRWTAFLDDLHATDEKPLKPGSALPTGPLPEGYEAWAQHNVKPQKQEGYSSIIVKMPLGDFTPKQGRGLADIAREFTGDSIRLTADQNAVIRWVSSSDLPAVYERLVSLELAEPGAGTLSDITSCPGTDTCKLGISSSRGLAMELRRRLAVVGNAADDLHVKCSGCFNSCGQHHVADIGFLGVSRVVGGRRVPHFQLVVGGEWTNNAGAYGLAIGAVPSKKVPEVVNALTEAYTAGRQGDEKFREWVERIGKRQVKALIDPFTAVPPYDVDPSYYTDWGDPREYTIGDIGVGECAGEVISFVEFGLSAAERELFEAQLLLDENEAAKAAQRAYDAMLKAARALARELNPNLSEDPDEIVSDFKKNLVDPQIFHDKYMGAKFAHYLLRAHADGLGDGSKESARQLLEEAQLFVDAAHACHQKMASKAAAAE